LASGFYVTAYVISIANPINFHAKDQGSNSPILEHFDRARELYTGDMRRLFPSLLFCALAGGAFCEITVENVEQGETLRYSVTLLRGVASGEKLKVVNQNNPNINGTNEVQVHDGRYVTVVELKPGRNHLKLMSGSESKQIEISYKTMKTPYVVNVVYVTPQDGDTHYATPYANDDFDYKARLDTAIRLMQTFTAEQMNMLGYGRKTFNLKLDKNGRIDIRTVAYPMSVEDLRMKDGNQLYSLLYGWIDKQFPMKTNKNIVIMGFSGYDGVTKKASAHTALGGGGQALFGGCDIFCWPRNLQEVEKVFSDDTPIDPTKALDDSAYRSTIWGVASTTIGAWLHESGHTFGLPHIEDPNDIMSRGFDRFNRFFTLLEPKSKRNKEPIKFGDNERAHWAPYYAAQLSVNRWFQIDSKLFKDLDNPKLAVVDASVRISAPNGLALVCCQVGDPVNQRWFKIVNSGPKSAQFSIEDLRKNLGVTGAFRVMAFDRQGIMTSLEVK
jgi:hypothetical protein